MLEKLSQEDLEDAYVYTQVKTRESWNKKIDQKKTFDELEKQNENKMKKIIIKKGL